MTRVLFDLFGTLVDSPVYSSPFAEMIAAGCPDPDSRQQAVDMTFKVPFEDAAGLAEILQRVNPAFRPSRNQLRETDEAVRQHIWTFSWVEGARDLLHDLRQERVELWCISNVTGPYCRILRDHGLGAFLDRLVLSCEVGLAKPDPRIFQLALEPAGCPPTHAIMVGDNELDDIEPARALGMRTYLVDNQAGSDRCLVSVGQKLVGLIRKGL